MRRRAFTAGALSAVAAPAIAQEWPSKPLRMVIPYPPGGPSDVSTRIVMDRAAQSLGQPIVFDNKAGASGMIGAEFAKNQAVDNHTFLTTTTAMVCITRHLQPIPFDPEKDFVTVSRMCTSWGIFSIHPSLPARTVAEFVAYAKANPGKINFGSSGLATITHLFGEMVQFDQTCLPHVKAGKLVGLAMLSNVRHPDFPDVPTLREAGYRKEEGDSWFGILAPTGTSPAVIAKLEKAIADAVRAPDIVEKLHLGGCYVTYLNAPDFRSRITDESKMFGNIIQKGNIKLT